MGKPILLALLVVAGLRADDWTRLIPPETHSIIVIETSRLRGMTRWPMLLDIAHHWKGFDDPVSTAGFDPSTDLDELALLEVRGENYGDLVVLRGRFDSSRIARFDRANEGGDEIRYRGVRVCAPPGPNGGQVLWTAAVADAVVIGPARTVKVAIDTYLSTGGRGLWFESDLARIRSNYDAGIVARVHMAGPFDAEPLRCWSGGIHLEPRPSAEFQADTSSPEQAQVMAHMVRDSIQSGWRTSTSRIWKLAAEAVRVSVDQRTVRVDAEMDWEPLLVLAGSVGRF